MTVSELIELLRREPAEAKAYVFRDGEDGALNAAPIGSILSLRWQGGPIVIISDDDGEER
jgi:hypothetical protein